MKSAKLLGNIFIALSLFGFFYIFFPVLSAYLFPSSMPPENNREFALWIPKIKASGTIIPNVNPWNESSYREILKKGIALGQGFSVPGEKGPIYLFAHSSGPPWELTRYNTVFLRLRELEKNDSIVIWRNNKEYDYKVVDKKEISPFQIQEVTQRKDDVLIIQTCTPLGTDWKRLLIFAKLKG